VPLVASPVQLPPLRRRRRTATTDRSSSRPARRHELDKATETVTLAFAGDPVWTVALGRPDGRVYHHAPYWRMFVEAALDQDALRLVEETAPRTDRDE